MGAYIPGTLILANSDQGRQILAANKGSGVRTPALLAPQALTAGGGAESATTVLFPPIAVINGILDGIFGGVTQQPLTDVQVAIGKQFPNPDTPVCGQPIDIGVVNYPNQATMTIPCDDPQFGGGYRARDLDNLIVFYGLSAFFNLMSKFISVGPTNTSTSGGGGGGEGPITVIANIDNSIPANVLRAVQLGINSGLDSAASEASKIAENTTSQITSSLESFTQQLGKSTDSIGNYIGGVLDNTLNNLFNPSSLLEQSINGSLSAVASLITSIQSEIVGPLEQQIAGINAAFGGLPASIESIFQGLIKNLPQILGGLLTSTNPILQQIAHAIEVIWGKLPKVVSDISWDEYGTILTQIAKAGAAIAGAANTPDNVIYRPMDPLGPSCGSVEENQKKINDWLGSNITLPCWIKDGMNGIRLVLVEILRLLPFIEQFYEQSTELQNASCQMMRLDPGTIIRAWRRGITTAENVTDELIHQGMNPARIKILQDLTSYYYGAQEAIDLFYRQIITPDQLNTLLSEIGMNASQIQAAKDGSFRITPIEDGIKGWIQGVLTDDQLSEILGTNRLNTYQQDLLKILAKRPPNPGEALKGQLTRDALGTVSFPLVTDFDTIPSWFSDSCAKSGLDTDTTRYLWWAHFDIGGIGNWISAYYRGLRLPTELVDVAKAFGIPQTVLADLIESGRPLLPFRSIGTFLKAGVISHDDAKSELSKHGFDSKHIDWLLAYANRTNSPAAATAVSNLANLSLSTAHTLFDDGAITDDQYVAILEAHKIPADLAKTQAEAIRLANEAKTRKTHVTDLIAEVESGLLTVDVALTDLRAGGYTDAEIARFQVALRRSSTKTAKHPSIAELDKFYKAKLITADDYKNELQIQGWADPWLSAFLGLIVLPPTPSPAPGGATA